MTTPAASCPECGARLTIGSTRCDLCGYDLDAPDPDEPTGAPPDVASREGPSDAASDAAPAQPAASRAVQYCGQCGAQNPAAGRFCTMCGTPLVTGAEGVPVGAVPPSYSGAPPAEPSRGLGKKALGWGGAVLALTLLLFAVDRLSGTPEPPITDEAPIAVDAGTPPASPPAGTVSAPITATPEVEAQVAALEADIDAAGAEAARIGKRIELVEVLARASLYGRAAEAQAALAGVTQTAAAWATAGTLWLDHIPQVGPEQQAAVALQAIDAYNASLAIEDDPDVRVNLALAYQYDPGTPMGTVQQLQTVLEGYPDHPEANFNMGLMRARIGRIDEAIASMEKVVAVTDHDSPVHQRAELELAQLRGQQNAGS